ncbi:MAG: MarC family protein [Pseudomonadota bacterium]
MDTFSAIKFFGALFAIMNPISNLPVFLSVTEGAGASERRTIALRVVLYCVILGGAFAVFGNAILNLFGISVDDFRVAGGLVVLLIGLKMLNGSDSAAHHGTDAEKSSFPAAATVAFYPLTFPILVGPGTITTLILYRQQATTTGDLVTYAVIFGGLAGLIGVVFALAGRLEGYLSDTGRVIMTRLMGMILAAIAVEMISAGLVVLLPGLA